MFLPFLTRHRHYHHTTTSKYVQAIACHLIIQTKKTYYFNLKMHFLDHYHNLLFQNLSIIFINKIISFDVIFFHIFLPFNYYKSLHVQHFIFKTK